MTDHDLEIPEALRRNRPEVAPTALLPTGTATDLDGLSRAQLGQLIDDLSAEMDRIGERRAHAVAAMKKKTKGM